MVWKVNSENDCSLCNKFFDKIDGKLSLASRIHCLYLQKPIILVFILGVTETFSNLYYHNWVRGKIFYDLSTGKAFFSGRSDLSGRTCTQGLKSLGRPDWSSRNGLFLCHGLHCSSHCFLLKGCILFCCRCFEHWRLPNFCTELVQEDSN